MGSKMLSGMIVAVLLAIIAFMQGNGFLPVSVNPNIDGEVYLHIIDVGQGDAILIRTPSGNMIIDSGTNSSESMLKTYLSNN